MNRLIQILRDRGDLVNNNVDPSLYPCGYDAVVDFQTNLGGVLGDILNNIFGATESIGLNIEVDVSLIGTGDHARTNRETSLEGVYMGGTIRLNPDFLNCSKDQIYSTLMHEMIHAY